MRKSVLLIVLLAGCSTQPVSPTAESLLAQAKIASGGTAWDAIQGLHLQGSVTAGGLAGSFDELLRLDHQQLLQHTKLGPDDEIVGYDGKLAWTRGVNGEVMPEDANAVVLRGRTDAYINSFGYWFPARDAAEMRFEGTRTDKGTRFSVLNITPTGGQPFELWIDTGSGQVARAVEQTYGGTQTTFYSDYRDVGGMKIPFLSRTSVHLVSGSDDPGSDKVIQLERAEIDPAIAAAAFARPPQELHDFSMLRGPQAAIPFELINNHVYVPVKVNGYALRLLLDTGSFTLLTPTAAAKVGIKGEGALAAGGGGAQPVDYGFAKLGKLTVGDSVELDDLLIAVLPVPSFGDVEGTAYDGILGSELLSRLVTKIDYANRVVTLEMPADFRPGDAGTPLPLTFLDTVPMVDGTLDGLPGQFEIDTGSRGPLILWPQFVAEHKLAGRYAATPQITTGWGTSGAIPAQVARGGTLRLGQVEIARPIFDLATDPSNATTIEGDDGNIGGEILRRFTVTFDYSRQRMYLQLNPGSSEPFRFDQSGMWMNREDGAFVIKTVMSGGPAEQAGLKVGDRVTSIDGRPVAAMALTDFRTALRDDEPGTQFHLHVDDGKTSRDVVLVLRRLVPDTAIQP